MRILVVEDDIKTAAYIKKGLSSSGFTVESVDNGEDGLFAATQQSYDLLILDVMVPKLDGFSLLEKLRSLNNHVRVIFLTARDAVEDRVRGLEMGADDYLVKPFSFAELLARVRTLFRRNAAHPQQVLTVGDLSIDLMKRKVHRGTVSIELTPKEFNLLELLVRRQGEVLSRTYIAESVWDINFDTDTNVIDVAIRRLRQKMDGQFERKLIHTVRGMGYLLEER